MPKLSLALNRFVRSSHTAALAALMFGAAWLGKPADAHAIILYLTFQVPSQFAGTEFHYGDIIKYDTETGQSSLFYDADDHYSKKEGRGIDALEVLPDGTILFSSVDRARLDAFGGVQTDRNDVIHYDPVNHVATVVLDGLDHFTNKSGKATNDENIDVIDVLPDGDFLFSTKNDAIFNGIEFDGDDIFRYDPTTNTASLFFDGDILRENGRPNFGIDAFDILPDGRFLISVFKHADLVDPVDEELKIIGSDLIIYDPNTDTIELFLTRDDIPDWQGKHRNFTGVDTEPEVPQQLPVIPEPTSASLLGFGLLGTLLRRRKRLKS